MKKKIFSIIFENYYLSTNCKDIRDTQAEIPYIIKKRFFIKKYGLQTQPKYYPFIYDL